MPESIADVRSEFDRLSTLPESWDFHYLYHPFVLSCLPAHVDSLLDVGCGTGAFTRRVASRCAEGRPTAQVE
jgi:ubiquinone/menaquinone biosynthesis C-methylase UbiE